MRRPILLALALAFSLGYCDFALAEGGEQLAPPSATNPAGEAAPPAAKKPRMHRRLGKRLGKRFGKLRGRFHRKGAKTPPANGGTPAPSSTSPQ